MSIILALVVAGALAGWAASIAVDYLEGEQQTIDPE
jgi:hypothetical protein